MNVTDQREKTVERWFAMWLRQDDSGIGAVFEEDAVYIESWGPQYEGLAKIGNGSASGTRAGASCGGISSDIFTTAPQRSSNGTSRMKWPAASPKNLRECLSSSGRRGTKSLF